MSALASTLPPVPAAIGEAVLGIRELEKSYRTPEGDVRPVVRIPELSLARGEQVAIRGESGSGKTTFLNMIAGIVRADRGEVYVDGEEITALPEARRDRMRASKIGYVYQSFNLLQGYTCLENVLLAMRFGPRLDLQYARELLDRVGLSHRVSYVPRQLSQGQQQRVAVARALANRPKLVLADEPTGNLDARSAADVLGLLRQTCAGCGAALLVVSHDREVLGRFTRIEDFARLNLAAAVRA